MQKNKRIILAYLIKGEVCNRFILRKHFQQIRNPTNSSELKRNLNILEKTSCVTMSNDGYYKITKKGEDLLKVLTEISSILK